MQTNETLPTLDDIVFEHRNKAYGAYELRTQYNTNINRATLIGISLFCLLLLTNFLFAKKNNERILIFDGEHFIKELQKEVIPPIEKPKEVEPPKPIEQKKTVQYTDIQIVEHTENENPPPPQSEIDISIIGIVDKTGIISDEIAEAPPTEAPSVTMTVLEIKEDNTPFTTVEVQPSFMGGNSEMYKFLGKNLKYPTAAQRANIQGKVFLSFIVEKDGSITDIETMKGIGFGCDEEAMRVVKLMPKWIAGKQNGRNVRVKFTIPVFFKLND
ncbi:MAG: energy transducer TonB [Emticicia sp.]|nr:energy transducer TonB [Emticicia sp.]